MRRSSLQSPGRRGLTLVESLLSMVIVGVMLTAAVSTLGAAKRGTQSTLDRDRGLLLAEDLMAEILQQAYADPAAGLGSWGVGGDESNGTRSLFEDVDDYSGWDESPPKHKDGSSIDQFSSAWRRTVSVAWVNPADFTQTQTSESYVKRITVTVKKDNRVVATLVAVRTAHTVVPLGP